MGYGGKPIGPDLITVTVVLQYGVFPTEGYESITGRSIISPQIIVHVIYKL